MDERSDDRVRPEGAAGRVPRDRPHDVTRRAALKVLAAGAAGAAALPAIACGDGASGDPSDSADRSGTAGGTATGARAGSGAGSGNPLAAGTPTDPDLLNPVITWDLVLTDDEMEIVGALCDVIIPADDRSPSATRVGAHEFINEWVSAPYDGPRNDLVMVRGGLQWLNRESRSRFDADFIDLTLDQKHRICDDIKSEADAAPEFRTAARFFDKIRDLTSTGFWTTAEGMADLGYTGNVPLTSWDGPPREVLERLGLA